MKLSRERVEALLARLERAQALLAEGRIHRVEGLPGVYVANGGAHYLIHTDQMACTCPDHQKNGQVCKHLLAALLLEREARKETAQEKPEGPSPRRASERAVA